MARNSVDTDDSPAPTAVNVITFSPICNGIADASHDRVPTHEPLKPPSVDQEIDHTSSEAVPATRSVCSSVTYAPSPVGSTISIASTGGT